MSAYRLDEGGEIDRARPLSFTYDGRPVQGFVGDSYASALMASGDMVLGRSFKYRRPRGIFGAGVEEPNIHADIRLNGRVHLNQRVTTEPAQDGAMLRACGAAPGARTDRTRFVDLFARFIPSGFYYKTFMRPNWHLFGQWRVWGASMRHRRTICRANSAITTAMPWWWARGRSALPPR